MALALLLGSPCLAKKPLSYISKASSLFGHFLLNYQGPAILLLKSSNQKPLLAHLFNMPN